MYDSPREMYALVEEQFGAPFAKWSFRIVVLGAMAASVLVIGTVVFQFSRHVVLPLTPYALSLTLPAGTTQVLIALTVSTLIFTAIAVLLWRQFKSSISLFDSYVRDTIKVPFDARLKFIEAHSAEYEGTRNSIAWLIEEAARLDTRIASIEKRGGQVSPAPKDMGTLRSAMLGPIGNLAQPLHIHEARYGYGERWVDVTQAVKGQVVDNRIDIPKLKNVHLGCDGPNDPFPGQRKWLEIKYSLGGALRPLVRFEEKAPLRLP